MPRSKCPKNETRRVRTGEPAVRPRVPDLLLIGVVADALHDDPVRSIAFRKGQEAQAFHLAPTMFGATFAHRMTNSFLRSARFVRGGQEILTAGGDGTVRLWDGTTGRLRQTYRGGSRFLADATLSPDGSMVVAGDADGLLRFWDTSNGRPLWTFPAHKSHLVGIHFEGNDIVTRGIAGDVSRWTLPKPGAAIECDRTSEAATADGELCGIVAR